MVTPSSQLVMAAAFLSCPSRVLSMTLLKLKWSSKGLGLAGCPSLTGSASPDIPAIVAGTLGGEVVALDGHGEEMWRVSVGSKVSSWPIIDQIGKGQRVVLAASEDGALACLTLGGEVLWRAELEAPATSFNSVGVLHGTGKTRIVVTDRQGRVTAVDPAGRIKWSFHTHGKGVGPAAIADLDGDGEEEIVFTAGDGRMYSLDIDGSPLWSVNLGGGAEYSAPVVADFGDGPCILSGSLHDSLKCFDRDGNLLWTQRGKGAGGIEVGISLGDLNRDGKDEVVFCHAGKSIQSVNHSGELVWSTYYGGGDQPFGPSIADVDGDGYLEMLFAQRDGPTVRVLDRFGKLLEEYPIEGGMIGAPVVGDLDCDGFLEVLMVEQKTGDLLCFSSKSRATSSIPWPNSRGGYDGSAARVRNWKRAKSKTGRYGSASSQIRVSLTPRWAEGPRLGSNRIRFSGWEASKNCWLVVSLKDPDGVVHRTQIMTSSQSSEFELLSPGSYLLEARLVDSSSRTSVGGGKWEFRLKLLGEDTNRVMKMLSELELMEGSDVQLSRDPRFTSQRILKQIPLYLSMNNPERRAIVHEVGVLEAGIQRHLACLRLREKARRKLGRKVRFFPWAPRHPWAEFKPGLQKPSELAEGIELLIDRGGHEAKVLQLENLQGEELKVRAWLEPVGSEKTSSVSNMIQLRQVTFVPTASGGMGGDAIPELGNGGILHLPASGSARLWIDIENTDRAPGKYSSTLKLRALVPEEDVWDIPIEITVVPTRLPKPMPIRFCNWGYVLSSPLKHIAEEAIRDMHNHHTNVFVLGAGTAPQASYDSKGHVVEVDWRRFDWLLDLLSDEDIILVPGGLLKPAEPGAPGEFSRQWRGAFKEFLEVFKAHLSEKGFGYENWAFYPVDEPGLLGGLLMDRLEKYARFYKEIDPKVQVYTDPFKGMTVEDMRRVLDVVDIFQPNFGAVVCEPSGERIAYLRSTGKILWTYEADGHVKDMVGVEYYWRQIWTAWELGLTGVGFWSYCTRPYDLWQGPNPNGNDWELVYQGAKKPVPSIRWQAVRIAIEDYARLWRLREASRRLERQGKRSQANSIKQLLKSTVERARSSLWDPEVVSSLRKALIEASAEVKEQLAKPK